MAPQRIQLSRRKGFRLQEVSMALNGLPCVVCTRASKKLGNPFRVGMWRDYTAEDAVLDYRRWLDREPGIRSAENAFGKPPTRAEIQAALQNRNVACACGLDETCHADVLLEIANA